MCEYCEPPYKDLVYLKPLEMKVFIDKTGRLWLRHYDKSIDMTLAAFNTMNCCPMCGRKLTEAQMPRDNYPLHPGQTHAQPLYAQIPLEEYERMMAKNKQLKEVLKRHGITLLNED